MAESVLGRLSAEILYQSNEKAGRESYSGSAEYVEGRAWLVGIVVFDPIHTKYTKFRVLPRSWWGRAFP